MSFLLLSEPSRAQTFKFYLQTKYAATRFVFYFSMFCEVDPVISSENSDVYLIAHSDEKTWISRENENRMFYLRSVKVFFESDKCPVNIVDA